MTKYFLVFAIVAMQSLFAQHKQSELTAEYLKSDEAMREDEYANSLKRRDWLQNRLIFSAGAGSKYAVWGAGFPSFGAAVEYITQWHVGVFGSAGYIFPKTDYQEGQPQLAGAPNYRIGLTYTFLPKLALHPGISISYGHSYYDHEKDPFAYQTVCVSPQGDYTDMSLCSVGNEGYVSKEEILRDPATSAPQLKATRDIVFTSGFQIEGTLTYMTNEWYYFSLNVGASHSGKPGSSTNKSTSEDGLTSEVIGDTKNGISEWNFVIAAGIGIALPELFPDKTEIRRRQREKARNKLGI